MPRGRAGTLMPMWRPLLVWGVLIWAAAGSFQAASAQSMDPSPSSPYRAVLNRYCVTCHNERLRRAELVLGDKDVENVSKEAEVWEKVIGKLRSRAMPPAGAPRPDEAFYDGFVRYLTTELDRAAAAQPNPGRPAIHRLNRTEYANAIRDLLAIEINAEALLPLDNASYGFDNIGDVLTVSPALLERYLSAAAKISRLAVGDSGIGLSSETYTVSERLLQNERVSEALPFGSRGGIAIRHIFPLDAEYEIRIRLQRDRVHDIIGLAEPHRLDVRLDGALLESFPVGGEGEEVSEFGGQDYQRPANQTGEESYHRAADKNLVFRFPATAGPHVIGVAFLSKSGLMEGPFRKRFAAEQYGSEDDIPGVGTVTVTGPYAAKGAGGYAQPPHSSYMHPSCPR